MSYKQKPNLKVYEYKNGAFSLVAIIDDYADCSFENNLYQAGQFTITINYNIANASVFKRGLFVSFGATNEFGEILKVSDSIGEEGAGSQIRTITGYDARYLLKRRVIKNLNQGGFWQMTAKGELCMRNLIKDQCGSGAEVKRQLPIINTIPADADAIGKDYSVSENFTNLYDVCVTIATQSEIGWKIDFDGTDLTLDVFGATDKSATVKFDTSFESLANGEFGDSSESYANAIYIGGKGQNEERDIYEGEDGSPESLERFEAWDSQTSLTTEDEYEAEALSMLNQYGQTISLSGNGLARCPYIYKEDYNVGDLITVAFSGHSAKVQILSITEHWEWGTYDLQFQFGKPINDLSDQLNLILRQIQRAGNKASACTSVKWYTIPTDTEMAKSDVFFDTIGFTGASTSDSFTIYLDDEGTGAKVYNLYVKNLTGSLTLTTGFAGAEDLIISGGSYTGSILVDTEGNIVLQSSTVAVNSGATPSGTANTIQVGGTTYNLGGGGSGVEVYPTEADLKQDLPNKQVGSLVGTYGNDLDVLADDKAIIINSSMISYSGGVCTIALNSGIPVTGGIYKLYFGEGILDSNAITSILITSGGVQGNLITKNGNVASHSVSEFTHNGVSVAPTNLAIDWYTVLEVLWNGSDWLVIGNPEVASYKGSDKNFICYANGYIKQWGKHTRVNSGTITINFCIEFKESPSVVVVPNQNASQGTVWNYFGWNITTASFQYNNNGQAFQSWDANGY